jgi:hypothetical protein
MVKYQCPRCHYSTTHRTNLKTHLYRKKTCKNTFNLQNPIETTRDSFKEDVKQFIVKNVKQNKELKSSVNLGKITADYCENTANYCKTTANYCKTPANYCKTTANYCENINLDEISIKSSEDSVKIESDDQNNLICQYCNKIFTRKENLENHLKKSCKMLKEFNNIYKYDDKTFGKNIYKDCENAGDIYIIQTDYINDDHYKIGITNNIKKRMGKYRCGNRYEPRLHYYISCKDIKLIDNKIKIDLGKYCVKREIFKGNVVDIKNKIVEVIKKEFKINKVYVHEPGIKIGDLSECGHCNKCFYNKNDLFDHFNSCENYKEYLSKELIRNNSTKCEFCQKEFSRKDNLERHQFKCKKSINSSDDFMKIENQLLKEQLQKFEDREKKWAERETRLRIEIEKLLEKVGNVTHITNQQNIYINNHGHENLEYISGSYMSKLLKIPFGALPKLIKHIHFNPDHPENHNIKITNKKLPYASVWEGDKWTVKDKKEVIANMVDNGFNILDDHYDNNGKEDLNNNQTSRYTEFKSKFQSGDKKLTKNVVRETEITVINQSK